MFLGMIGVYKEIYIINLLLVRHNVHKIIISRCAHIRVTQEMAENTKYFLVGRTHNQLHAHP